MASQTLTASSPRFNPPLAQHSNNVWLRWCRSCRAAAPSRGGRRSSTTDARTFLSWRKPTPRSVCIVNMQDSNATTVTTGAGTGGRGGGRREPGTGTVRTMTTWVSSSAVAIPPHHPSSSLFRSLVWSRAAKTSAIGGLSPTPFSSSQTPDARLRAAIVTPPKFPSSFLYTCLFRPSSTSVPFRY
jgi:hypothetical protein